MTKLGVCIVGAGAIASVHIEAYRKYGDICEVKAVCDLFAEKAEELIKNHGLNAKAYKDYKEALEDESIDVVSVCLPPSMHAQVTVDACNKGKHVICEKPMANSLEECDRMIEAAEKNKVVLSSVAQNRYKTPNMKVKKLLDENILGDLRLVTVNSLWWRGECYYDLWWRGTWEKEGGGILLSHAVHHIDLLLWMVGKPLSVRAYLNNVSHFNSECEDFADAILKYKVNGKDMIGHFTTTLVNHKEEASLSFDGVDGSISIPYQVAANVSQPNGFPDTNQEMLDKIEKAYKALPELETEGHEAQIENFLNAILGREKLLISGEDGRNTIEFVTAMYKSAGTNTEVILPIEKDDPFYKQGNLKNLMPHFHEKTKSIENFAASKPISLGRDIGK